MSKGDIKRTSWARRNREVLDSFTGFRLASVELQRLRRIADLLNVDVSDLLRSMVRGLLMMPLKTAEIGATLDEIKSIEKINPPTTSDKIRYV